MPVARVATWPGRVPLHRGVRQTRGWIPAPTHTLRELSLAVCLLRASMFSVMEQASSVPRRFAGKIERGPSALPRVAKVRVGYPCTGLRQGPNRWLTLGFVIPIQAANLNKREQGVTHSR